MNLKKSLLIALFSFGVAQSAFAETDQEKFDRAVQYTEQQNYAAAFPLFKQLAEQGNARSQFNLAFMYDNGEGVAQNHKQAFYWFQKAAEQGLAEAQFILAAMHEKGQGVAQDHKQAAYWYQKAAEQGNALAQINLAFMYEKGLGVAQDYKQAVYWHQEAAKQRNADAHYILGLAHLIGEDVRLDKAKYHFGLACDNGDADACKFYADLEREGVR